MNRGEKSIVLLLVVLLIVSLAGCRTKEETLDTESLDTNGTLSPSSTPSLYDQGSSDSKEDEDQNTISSPESDSDLTEKGYTTRDLTGEYYDSVTEILLGSESVIITEPGTYILSGILSDGQIVVNAGDNDKVQLVLNNADITNSSGPAIYVRSADKVFITLPEGTTSSLTDGASYNMNDDENDPDGCIFSKDDLTINGSGTVNVVGNYGHGIITKDDLTITGGTINITAVNEGLKGKDSVKICDGLITINAGDDAIATGNEEDEDKGWMTIDGGTFILTSGDDALHADGDMTINGGDIAILSCTEGIEGRSITITGGSIVVASSDDGVNAAGGVGSTQSSPLRASSINTINISGGTLWITSYGDGLDANGSIEISGGNIFISQTGNNNNAIDGDGGLTITGGVVVAAGASQMAEAFSSNSTQYSFLYSFGSTISGGTEIAVSDAAGSDIIQFTPELDYQCVIVSTPEMKESTYTITAGNYSGEITLTGISTSNRASGMSNGFGGGGYSPIGNGGPRR